MRAREIPGVVMSQEIRQYQFGRALIISSISLRNCLRPKLNKSNHNLGNTALLLPT